MNTRSHTHQIDTKLRIRLRIFAGISFVLLAFAASDVLRGDLVWWEAVVTLLLGIGIGYLFGRAVRIRWHENEEKVVTQMDMLGGIAIAAYILLAIGRRFILGEFVTGAALTALTLAAVSGILMGRFLGMRYNIEQVLRERTR